jgi:hypothetical protein
MWGQGSPTKRFAMLKQIICRETGVRDRENIGVEERIYQTATYLVLVVMDELPIKILGEQT